MFFFLNYRLQDYRIFWVFQPSHCRGSLYFLLLAYHSHFLIWEEWKVSVYLFVCLFTILHPFGTRESITQKVDHGGQIVFLYWQHATNLAKATVFVVYRSSARMLMWVKGKAKQKHSLTFYVFGQIKSKCSSSSTFPKSQSRQSLLAYGTPFHALNTTSSCMLPHRNWATAFHCWIQLMSHK